MMNRMSHPKNLFFQSDVDCIVVVLFYSIGSNNSRILLHMQKQRI